VNVIVKILLVHWLNFAFLTDNAKRQISTEHCIHSKQIINCCFVSDSSAYTHYHANLGTFLARWFYSMCDCYNTHLTHILLLKYVCYRFHAHSNSSLQLHDAGRLSSRAAEHSWRLHVSGHAKWMQRHGTLMLTTCNFASWSVAVLLCSRTTTSSSTETYTWTHKKLVIN